MTEPIAVEELTWVTLELFMQQSLVEKYFHIERDIDTGKVISRPCYENVYRVLVKKLPAFEDEIKKLTEQYKYTIFVAPERAKMIMDNFKFK